MPAWNQTDLTENKQEQSCTTQASGATFLCRSGVAPIFGGAACQRLCPCGGARGDEVSRTAGATTKYPSGNSRVLSGKQRTPQHLKERWDPLQGGATWRGFGLVPRLLWQEGLGARRVPSAPGMPAGERPGWWRHPWATALGRSLGRAWDVGLEGLGSGQQRLGQRGIRRAAGESWACVFTRVCVHVRVCSCICMRGVALSSELALGKGGDARGGRTWDAESG